MPSEDYMSDDYVASLMTKDAKESTIKYSALGLQALLPKRPTTTAPRPNTRFLKNIIRETDSHNALLKLKETQEAKLRLRRLKEGDTHRRSSPDSTRRSHKDADTEDRPPPKRRRLSEDEGAKKGTQRRHKEFSDHTSSRAGHRDERDRRKSRRNDESSPEEDRTEPKSSSHHHRRHHHRHTRPGRSPSRSRSRSPNRSDRHHRSKYRRRDRSHSRDRDRDRDRPHRKSHRRKSRSSSPAPDTKPPPPQNPPSKPAEELEAEDSDPLESIIGPAPPPPQLKVRARGRGAFASSSTMDAHFSATYDPTTDVRPNSDSENDWDQALEALRDRQRWQKQGADRLREAGFGEDFVKKWEKGGEKTGEDVKWRGRGEGREWDRGKVVDTDGHIDTKPEWGRLKGT
ncbi:hypothetical protein MMC30_007898 [Trapelia coarctata]|nr:hypothetical protein [Trapelia coarctata]